MFWFFIIVPYILFLSIFAPWKSDLGTIVFYFMLCLFFNLAGFILWIWLFDRRFYH